MFFQKKNKRAAAYVYQEAQSTVIQKIKKKLTTTRDENKKNAVQQNAFQTFWVVAVDVKQTGSGLMSIFLPLNLPSPFVNSE